MVFTVYPTNTEAVGALNEVLVKENVEEEISNMFPTSTPQLQVFDKMQMGSVFHEFPIDTFTTITRTSAVIVNSVGGPPTAASFLAKPEGFTGWTSTTQYPTKFKTVAEIQGDLIEVSNTDRAIVQHAIGDRFDFQAVKIAEAVVNNQEWSRWWSKGTPPQGKDVDSTGTTLNIRQTQGLMYLILHSGLERQRTGSSTIPGNCTTVADYFDCGTTGAAGNNNFGTNNATLCAGGGTWAFNANGAPFDSAMFKTNLMEPWYRLTNRQSNSVGFASPKMKTLFNAFALNVNGLINTRTIAAETMGVIDNVDWYRTEFGLISVNMCPYLSQSGVSFDVLLADGTTTVTVAVDECFVVVKPEYFKIGVLRPTTLIPYGVVGDLEKALIVGESGLMCRNPQGGSAIVNGVP